MASLATYWPYQIASKQHDDAERGRLPDLAGPDTAHVDAHEHGGRNGDRDREGSPRAFAQRLHDDQPERRKDDDHDAERADESDAAGDRAHLHLHHFAEGAAVAPDRAEQDDEVLHRAGEHHADENPQRPGQVSHLRGQHRPDQRPGARDRREMVPEHDVFVGGHVVEAVVVAFGRRQARIIQLENLRRR